jgi:NitT/TauT family transport system permease protein
MSGRRLINRRPHGLNAAALVALPFLLTLAGYVIASQIRLAANAEDKLLPGFATIGGAIARMAFTPDVRTGTYLFWVDTASSLIRLVAGVAIAALAGATIGILQGLLPYVNRTLHNYIAVVSMIPPLAILPILFIVFGLGETSKIVLIFIGLMPFIVRDLALRVEELPAEQIIKAQTLGAGTWGIILRVVLPQMLPRLIDSVRLSMGAAWLFLIAAEAIAAESGLGYRIFLMRRYLAMDVILPYVAWITFLAFAFDYLLRQLQRAAFPWLRRAA